MNEKESSIFKKFISDFFYLDNYGIVNQKYNECFKISEEMPEFCETIKKYVEENWQLEFDAKKYDEELERG